MTPGPISMDLTDWTLLISCGFCSWTFIIRWSRSITDIKWMAHELWVLWLIHGISIHFLRNVWYIWPTHHPFVYKPSFFITNLSIPFAHKQQHSNKNRSTLLPYYITCRVQALYHMQQESAVQQENACEALRNLIVDQDSRWRFDSSVVWCLLLMCVFLELIQFVLSCELST